MPKRREQTPKPKRLSPYAQFTERGYQVKAYISGPPKTHFVVRVSKGGKRIREEHLPPMSNAAWAIPASTRSSRAIAGFRKSL